MKREGAPGERPQALLSIGAVETGDAPNLGAKAAVCVIPAIAALSQAATNVQASVDASVMIAGALGVE